MENMLLEGGNRGFGGNRNSSREEGTSKILLVIQLLFLGLIAAGWGNGGGLGEVRGQRKDDSGDGRDFLVVLTAEFGQNMKEDAEEGFLVPEKYHHRCHSNNYKWPVMLTFFTDASVGTFATSRVASSWSAIHTNRAIRSLAVHWVSHVSLLGSWAANKSCYPTQIIVKNSLI